KFAGFQEVATKLGADYFAYGHYARKVEKNGDYFLLRGKDNNKDQSYFLSQLNQDQLSKSLFPVGELNKKEVRQIAIDNHIPTATKKDSTGICFIGERDFKNFLKNYIYTAPGEIQTLDGTVIGHHDGLMYYTIGQRKGLNIGGDSRFSNQPWFVVGKDIKKNVLLAGQGINHPRLFSNRVIVEGVNWIAKEKFSGILECSAKFRYRQEDNTVLIKWLDETTLEVIANKPIRAVTPGQAAVFYQDDVCLGGGTINEVFQNQEKLMY
ncbi:MAG: tRNA 2-thiouridine(34) synthase MnmA, partial [Candidatus Izemoplasmatales bacterium]|nr:tRNA 2-thiouridine(34) synthase MnmA [Candidatus Izemoplasmatales bacterium]